MAPLVISIIAASIACLLALAWLLSRPLPQESLAPYKDAPDGPPSEHARRFPQLRHPLSGTDSPYVKHHATRQIEKHWRDDRRHVVKGFLFALADDFARLEQLAALANAMLPKELARQRRIPFSLLLQFRTNYRLASLLLRMHSPASTLRIIRLTELLGNLSAHTEASMAMLTTLPPEESCAPLSKVRPD
jgi:hypothetical protein